MTYFQESVDVVRKELLKQGADTFTLALFDSITSEPKYEDVEVVAFQCPDCGWLGKSKCPTTTHVEPIKLTGTYKRKIDTNKQVHIEKAFNAATVAAIRESLQTGGVILEVLKAKGAY